MQDSSKDKDWLNLDKEDLLFIGELGGFETEVIDDNECETDGIHRDRVACIPNSKEILTALSTVIITDGPDAFVRFVCENKEDIRNAAIFDDDIVRALLVGYKMGINLKNGACANDLGAMYYSGDLVEQDYQKAAELYELAIQWGCDQSVTNMGYIYEYGRLGKPDYARAYEYYSLASALTQMSEALYKLGDMYSRGRSVERDMARAVQLWNRSLQNAHGPREIAQPAIRLAPLYLDGSEEANIKADPMFALELYQRAEIGLRLDIKDGLDYYENRLKQAVEGQGRARSRLDEVIFI